MMLVSHLAKCTMILLIVFQSGCTQNRTPNIVAAEEGMVRTCNYLDTISEVSDPGKLVIFSKFSTSYDGELKVLERASAMGGSHIVWMYNYPIGSSASVYRCTE
jgi:hypothetical protein